MAEEYKKMPNEDSFEFEVDVFVFIRNFIKSVFKFWWLIGILALVFGCAFYWYSSTTYAPTYRAQATFTVATNTENSDTGSSYDFYYDSVTAEQLSLTFPHILSSELFTDAMKEALNSDTIKATVSASVISNSNMVVMSATGATPEDAKTVLEAAISVYPEVSRFVIGETKFNMIDPPTLPESPYNPPQHLQRFVMGLAIGIVLGLGLILLYVFFRKTVLRREDLQNLISLQCLGSLSLIKQKERKSKKDFFPLVTEATKYPWFAENVETVRLGVENALSERNKKVLLVTSTTFGEGKSLVAANIAYKLADRGKKVLLVSYDFRKQALAGKLGIEPSFDESKYVPGVSDIRDFITDCEQPNLFFFGSDKPIGEITKLLPHILKEINEKIKPQVDYIIVDAPPTEGLSDVLVMKDFVDSFLYVVKHDYAPRSKIVEAISLLEEEGADVIGYIFNGVSGVFGEYGYYGYSRYGHYGRYGYGHYGKYTKYSKYSNYGYGDIKDDEE